jgi:GAF domain-containing protein
MAKAASRGDSQTVFELVVRLAKAKLSADRVVIYRFNDNWSGSVVAEAIDANWVRALHEQVNDPCMPRATLDSFHRGKIVAINDVEAATTLVPQHRQLLEQLQVKAYLVVPIVSSDRLLGLLIAHQCLTPRTWQPAAINMLQELAAQTGLALTGVTLAAQKAADAERASVLQSVTHQVRQSLDTTEILQQSVEAVRLGMGCDRVVIYRFHPDWKSGDIAAESVGMNWLSVLGQTIHDPLADDLVERYARGRVWSTDNMEDENLTNCHCDILRRLQVKANIVAPVIVNGSLYGLLCGHQCATPRIWEEADINLFTQLANQIGFALDQARILQKQVRIAENSQHLNTIVSKMRQSTTAADILNTMVTEVRQAFRTDRVIVYQFHSDWNGTIIAESVQEPWNSILGETVTDPFREGLIERYRNGRVRSMDDIYAEGLTDCHRDILEGFQIRASITAPMILNDELIGLLCIHQCDGPRQWFPEDLELFRQLATQAGFALEQAELYAQREAARLEAEHLAEEQRQKNESLQHQLLTLLNEVEGAVSGNLTVRADVVAGEIGIVADFFNAIVESSGQVVTQVKQSTMHVNESLSSNAEAMEQLTAAARKQSQDTTRILKSTEKMTQSVRAVANSAYQAAEIARIASTTAETSGEAMDLTVQNILTLRGTIGETAKKVKRLGESSQQISRVVSLIQQIAMQTNLLAVNAGIEAAKAGEQGQGFAVVAEEVSELAARSATATLEIEQIVETIQRETSDVVKAMEQGTTQVVEGTQLVTHAKQSLEQILGVSREIDQLVQSISDATVSQVETSHAISDLMQDAAKVAEQTSTSSRQVSDALRQTVAIAQDLQASVGTFVVN